MQADGARRLIAGGDFRIEPVIGTGRPAPARVLLELNTPAPTRWTTDITMVMERRI
jgi:hypothetical protein